MIVGMIMNKKEDRKFNKTSVWFEFEYTYYDRKEKDNKREGGVRRL